MAVFHVYVPATIPVHVPPSIEIVHVATEVAASETIYTTDTLPITTFAPGKAPSTKVIFAVGAVLSTLNSLVTVAITFPTSSSAVTRMVYVPSNIL